MEIILVPLGNQVSILSDLFLVNIIDLNLSELRLIFYRKKMLCSIRYRFYQIYSVANCFSETKQGVISCKVHTGGIK